jgi:hypothetical protein
MLHGKRRKDPWSNRYYVVAAPAIRSTYFGQQSGKLSQRSKTRELRDRPLIQVAGPCSTTGMLPLRAREVTPMSTDHYIQHVHATNTIPPAHIVTAAYIGI